MDSALPPLVYQEFLDFWQDPATRRAAISAYTHRAQSFIPNLLPQLATRLSSQETFSILKKRFGASVEAAIEAASAPPGDAVTLSLSLRSPAAQFPDSTWIKHTNMVGVNVRTVGNFWNVVKYALTLPAAQDSVHLLPIWEPGVAGSLYGISSWHLNPEFFSHELAAAQPNLDTVGKQLRLVVHLLHVMGKTVGMDVIPHTDRFSEIVLSFPEHFEWLQRQDTVIISHKPNLHLAVQRCIKDFLATAGVAVEGDAIPPDLFDPAVAEETRTRLLFGLPEDRSGRELRRGLLIQQSYRYGYEPVPATMAPPYRGLAVDTRPETLSVDGHGQGWREYVITQPEPMSRVFGPLTRYHLYESMDDPTGWKLDFNQPRRSTWDYVCRKYAGFQREFGFDFMRGDMSHVQMRPAGVPTVVDDTYDLLGAVKTYIQLQGVPYFAYFAETFIAPRNVMGYGEEMDHLEAAKADATLGDLQSSVPGSPQFLQQFRLYLDFAATRKCVPSFTLMTADKDDPRFDHFYTGGSAARYFIASFLPSMPSYMGLGFEARDTHTSPAPNEHYTKLYIFQQTGGPKATQGPYVWGKNGILFSEITRIRQAADRLAVNLAERTVRWLIPPDAGGNNPIIAWKLKGPEELVFIANTSSLQPVGVFGLPGITPPRTLTLEFTTSRDPLPAEAYQPVYNGVHYQLSFSPGEARIYRVNT